ncbi:class II aldolase/adducin N-terminal [Aspergillus granulosus]|uniref:Class II aldolase/adducin N-terminal n=1 Tax=Aspergillus granulosus TaxID=176169 RepID=A0ABR4GYK8_9EURO
MSTITTTTATTEQPASIVVGGVTSQKRQWQLEHTADAFRVFARKGFTEGTSGHISVRDPVDLSTSGLTRKMGKHFGMLKTSDMVQIDENGQVIGGNRTAVNAAGFMIHSAIHKLVEIFPYSCDFSKTASLPSEKTYPSIAVPSLDKR